MKKGRFLLGLPRKVGNEEKVWPTKAYSSQQHK